MRFDPDLPKGLNSGLIRRLVVCEASSTMVQLQPKIEHDQGYRLKYIRQRVHSYFGGDDRLSFDEYNWDDLFYELELSLRRDRLADNERSLFKPLTPEEANTYEREAKLASVIVQEYTIGAIYELRSLDNHPVPNLTPKEYLRNIRELSEAMELNTWFVVLVVLTQLNRLALAVDSPIALKERFLTPEFEGALNRENFGKWFTELREGLGKSQREFADDLGISKSKLARIETGDQALENSFAVLEKMGMCIAPSFVPCPKCE